MAQLFTPPTFTERPVTGERLTETRLKITRGVSVLKNRDSSFTSITYPTTDDFANSLFVYQGGHIYLVSDGEAALLAAAGYGSNLTAVVADSSGYSSTYNSYYGTNSGTVGAGLSIVGAGTASGLYSSVYLGVY